MMKPKYALMVILTISIVGMLFSGYLAYSELVKQTCALGTCTSVGGLPSCVYGFVMYLVVAIFSGLGLAYKGTVDDETDSDTEPETEEEENVEQQESEEPKAE